MARSAQVNSGHPVPQYVMPDRSVPEYRVILEQIREFHTPLIGKSYYYIRRNKEFVGLCRIIPGGGEIFFHEIVDHERYGISETELCDAVRNGGIRRETRYYPISPGIETKLRLYSVAE